MGRWGSRTVQSIVAFVVEGIESAILAFDVGSIESYLHLDQWLGLMLDGEEANRFPIVIVGNKRELSDGSIRESDIEGFVTKKRLSGYDLVSAKEGVDVSSPFLGLLKLIVSSEAENCGSRDGKQ